MVKVPRRLGHVMVNAVMFLSLWTGNADLVPDLNTDNLSSPLPQWCSILNCSFVLKQIKCVKCSHSELKKDANGQLVETTTEYIVSSQWPVGALVFELAAPPLEQI